MRFPITALVAFVVLGLVGCGGSATDGDDFECAAFLSDSVRQLETAYRTGRWLTEEEGRGVLEEKIRVRDVCMPITIHLQPLIEHESEMDSNEMSVVVNQIHSGIGWLSSQFAGSDSSTSVVSTDTLSAWLVDAMAPAEPVELLYCNQLQDQH